MHGSYTRKGTHGVEGGILVLRLLCLNPDCGKTFSVLPKGLYPICRTPAALLEVVAEGVDHGQSPASMVKTTKLSLGILKRLVTWLAESTQVLISLARENGSLDNRADPASWIERLRLTRFWPEWVEFTYPFSRARYPRRWPLIPPGS